MKLTDRERFLVKESWKILKNEAGISNELVFYGSFFKLAPDAKKYFMDKSGLEPNYKMLTKKFAYTMDFIMDNIDDLEKIPKEIEDLGSLHNRLKIEHQFYPLFNESILEILNELLGDRCTKELRQAWYKTLNYITERMQLAPIKESNAFQKLLYKLFGKH